MVVEKEQGKADKNKTFEFHCCRAKKTKFHQPIEPYTKKKDRFNTNLVFKNQINTKIYTKFKICLPSSYILSSKNQPLEMLIKHKDCTFPLSGNSGTL